MTGIDSKRRLYYLSVSCFCLVLLLFLSAFVIPRQPSCDILKLREMIADDGHIIHAGGFIETEAGEVSYTNSLEAIVNLYY